MSLKDILNPEPKSPRSPSRPETSDHSLEPPSDVYMTDATTSGPAMSPAQELSRASPPPQQTLQPSDHPTTKVSEGVHQSERKFNEDEEVPLAPLTSGKEPTGKAEALPSAPEARLKVNQSIVTDSATITSDAMEETSLVKVRSPVNEESTLLPSHQPSGSEAGLDPKTTMTPDEKSSSSQPNKQDSATTDHTIATTKVTSDPTQRTTPSVDVKPEMPPPSPTVISPTSSVPPRLSELSPNADNVDGSMDKGSSPPPQGRGPGATAKPGKKRKLPPKKGTASLKKAPANKRLKRDSEDYSAESTRSNTPVSVLKSAASKNSTPKPAGKPKRGGRRSSHAPSDLSTSPAVAAEEEEDGVEVYCICRKPDNHEWMIGCDWGCDDWFHGTCVGFNKELAPLVDMYCCPNCAGLGRGPTTWRRKCQYEPCNNPASKPSSSDPEGSKFCSPEHGVQFFKDKAQTLLDGKKGKDGASGVGGTLTKSQLKALAEGVGSAEEFKALGDIGESDEMDLDKREDAEAAQDGNGESGEEYTAERLKAIAQQLDEMKASFALLTDKDTLINAVRDQYKSLHASGSRICGYHTLLSSSPAEFEAFRLSPAGQDLFAAPPAPPNTPAEPSETSPESSTPTEIGHGVIAQGRLDGFEEGLCRKGASCSQHRDWWRIAKEDVADAKRSCQERRRELQKEREECGVRIRMESLEGGNRGEGSMEALGD